MIPFIFRPLAHRALHGTGRPENSAAAIRAACQAGYGIEIDVQLSADGKAIVFHDYDLSRLTDESGPVRRRTASDLRKIALKGSMDERIPTLSDALAFIDGAVPLLIEIKDQSGTMGPDTGELERAVARDLAKYEGPVAVMSFNPHSVAVMNDLASNIPRGLATCGFPSQDWPHLPAATRDRLARIPDYDSVGASFISHQHTDLDNPRVAELKVRGAKIFCWTIRSEVEETVARKIADTITFEAYCPTMPALDPAEG